MGSWKKKVVKTRTYGGKLQVRKVGHKNLTDKAAKKRGLVRKAGIYSTTDKGRTRKLKKSLL